MFDQIKAEPLHFYQSSCPTQITQQQQAVLQHVPNHATVITINDDKDNLQARVVSETRVSSSSYLCTASQVMIPFFIPPTLAAAATTTTTACRQCDTHARGSN